MLSVLSLSVVLECTAYMWYCNSYMWYCNYYYTCRSAVTVLCCTCGADCVVLAVLTVYLALPMLSRHCWAVAVAVLSRDLLGH